MVYEALAQIRGGDGRDQEKHPCLARKARQPCGEASNQGELHQGGTELYGDENTEPGSLS